MAKMELNRLVILLLLAKNGGYDTSHAIIRLITRRFEMWDFATAIQDVVSDGLIVRGQEGTMDIYRTTDKGQELLKDQLASLHERMLVEFPSQKEFIALLF